jgi:hypothetical protein
MVKKKMKEYDEVLPPNCTGMTTARRQRAHSIFCSDVNERARKDTQFEMM